MNHKDLFSFEGRVILLTGGFGLLGSALVKGFLSQGGTVCLLDLKNEPDKLKHFQQISNNIAFYQGDITQVESIRTVVDQGVRNHGKIDILVNNAYPRNKNYGRSFEEIALSDWNENTSSHLGGYFNVTQQVVPQMKRQRSGNIVNIASIYGMTGPDFNIYEGTKMTMPAEYSAIKGGLINFTRYLATYLAGFGIRANSVSPGGIFDNQDPQFVENYRKRVPMGRMATPEDIVGAVLFLASDAARYITGQNLAVDGGWTAW